MLRLPLLLLTLLAGSFAVAAPADILVLRDGQRRETEGPYEVRGGRVVWRDHLRTLHAARIADVDLAASEQATRAQREHRLHGYRRDSTLEQSVVDVSKQHDTVNGTPSLIMDGELHLFAGEDLSSRLVGSLDDPAADAETRARLGALRKTVEKQLRGGLSENFEDPERLWAVSQELDAVAATVRGAKASENTLIQRRLEEVARRIDLLADLAVDDPDRFKRTVKGYERR